MNEDYQLKKNKEEMKYQVIVFSLMIFLTIIAFVSVYVLPARIVGYFLLLLAGIQVIFQLYYFMHLKEKGTWFVQLMIYSGGLIAALIVVGLVLLT